MTVFDELVGQNEAIAEIKRAAAAARSVIAHDDAVAGATDSALVHSSAMSHAWLFTGPPGSGRSYAARTFAAALLCSAPEPGCGVCAGCRAVLANNHPDVEIVSTDLVTISADEVRGYVTNSYLAPSSGKWRIFIIEDADRMISRTTNVLLKAIEEPAPRTVWMLCTAAVADVLPTIRSRCRNVNLVTPDAHDVARLLSSRDGIDPDAALVAAKAAQSHIGVARALATDPEAGMLRKNTLDALLSVRGVGDAVVAAGRLLDVDAMHGRDSANGKKKAGKTASAEQESAEREKLMDALGLDSGGRIPASVRSQLAADKDNAKRRQTRRERDMLDRELIYMQSFFRDVLVVQLGSEIDLVNSDYEKQVRQRAADSDVNQTIAKIDTLNLARERLKGNVAALLTMEAALISVR
ncbi:DNA polymerase-3 subunit delta' [Arcanobacterium pluranimalium]|uniref:DNA polymerase III subunit delta' n=1 Tax=Arcanobacterium pluranimalium TaxID=108028 RepID=UPI0019564872|nr:DNA polymerase III subunit delta' [Arcanobacterium pluranimalium]MBM7824511.1 DNA polymerase-3 subunit delta' [Arcanobacterium pluranimalium]